jgi:hypothetical protein
VKVADYSPINGNSLPIFAKSSPCTTTRRPSHEHPGLVALVQLSDLLCRMTGLNYGYFENRQVNLLEQTGFGVLSQQCLGLKDFDWARLTFEMDSYMDEVHALVRTIYRK